MTRWFFDVDLSRPSRRFDADYRSIHSGDAFRRCIPAMHSGDAFRRCIPAMHSGDAFRVGR
jgi:hypothetical protein